MVRTLKRGLTRRGVAGDPGQAPRPRGRGQSMVEFAMIATIALIVLMVTIQGAILADAALAVNQLVYQGVRYAAVNPSVADVSGYVKGAASPMINENNSGDLTQISLTCPGAANGVCPSPRTFATQVSLTITYDATSKIALPNPFMGIPFPKTFTATETAMSE